MLFPFGTRRHVLVLVAAITTTFCHGFDWHVTTGNDAIAADALGLDSRAIDTAGRNALRGVTNSRPFKQGQQDGMAKEGDDITIDDEPSQFPVASGGNIVKKKSPLGRLFATTKSNLRRTLAAGNANAAVTVSRELADTPVPQAWNGEGCPKAYAVNINYDAGVVVSKAEESYTMVYKCADEPSNLFCGMVGYSPGEGTAWKQVWTPLGSCSGSVSPTQSPNFDTLVDIGGCPSKYEISANYEEGDQVSAENLVYQCKSFPYSLHCSQAGFEPNKNSASPHAWKEAWLNVGYCSGTVAPTSSPNFVELKDMGGCPDGYGSNGGSSSWSWGNHVAYEEGDVVSVNGFVYECKEWPYSLHCSQQGYEPASNLATPGAWKDAWNLVGYCNGSMPPTSSPSFEALTPLGGCPDEWGKGSDNEYEEGDLVGVTVSNIPFRAVVYRCKSWPYSGHCGQFAPTDESGGSLGWSLEGSCEGSIEPTASPSFARLKSIGNCPEVYSSSYSNYEVGDQVSLTVSDSPNHNVVYQCREWPNSGYCNQHGSFSPTEKYSSWAWRVIGSCIVPSPVQSAPAPTAAATSAATAAPTTAPTTSPMAATSPTACIIPETVEGLTYIGDDICVDADGEIYDYVIVAESGVITTVEACLASCEGLSGWSNHGRGLNFSCIFDSCICLFENGNLPDCYNLPTCDSSGSGTGPIVNTIPVEFPGKCFALLSTLIEQ